MSGILHTEQRQFGGPMARRNFYSGCSDKNAGTVVRSARRGEALAVLVTIVALATGRGRSDQRRCCHADSRADQCTLGAIFAGRNGSAYSGTTKRTEGGVLVSRLARCQRQGKKGED